MQGTLDAFRAATAAGARRFVYASSVAAYGFHPDNPVGMTEEWPVRRADRLSYAQEKADLEHRLQEEAAAHPDTALYLLRPSVVLGPHTLGAKDLPAVLGPMFRVLRRGARLLPVPVVVPDLPVQFVHEEDVGSALLQCVVGAGGPGAYNIAADGVLSMVEVAREIGLLPLRVPGGPAHAAARLAARLPFLPSTAQWVEALSHPAVMDTTRARTELGWTPRFSALEALRDSL